MKIANNHYICNANQSIMNTNKILTMSVIFLMILPFQNTDAKKRKELTDRQNWCEIAYRMAEPVLRNMSEGKLQEEMLV